MPEIAARDGETPPLHPFLCGNEEQETPPSCLKFDV